MVEEKKEETVIEEKEEISSEKKVSSEASAEGEVSSEASAEGEVSSEASAEEEAEAHKQEAIEKSHGRHHPVKEKAVNKLVDDMQHAKTVMMVNIKGLPSKQFQDIKKSIREHAHILVAKKNILGRSIEKFGKESIKPLKENISENCALAISDMEGYELAGILSQKKTPVFAKAGQEAPEDIEVKAGPTDLVPGPAISELGAVGLQVAVVDGKLSIKESKTIVTKGQTINEGTASILQKLNIMPFSVGLEPVVVYDVEEEKIYTEIKIDSEEAAANLSDASAKALGFAQKIVYFCKETIGYLLAKANAEGDKLGSLSPKEEAKEEKAEEKKEETETKEEAPAEEAKEDGEAKEEKAEEAKPAEDKKEEVQPEIKSEEEK
jgi:large subunit ribosomal protein L10